MIRECNLVGRFIFTADTNYFYILAYLLNAGNVEPERLPLLASGSETTFVSRQRPQNR
jgi:hypothetical protein